MSRRNREKRENRLAKPIKDWWLLDIEDALRAVTALPVNRRVRAFLEALPDRAVELGSSVYEQDDESKENEPCQFVLMAALALRCVLTGRASVTITDDQLHLDTWKVKSFCIRECRRRKGASNGLASEAQS